MAFFPPAIQKTEVEIKINILKMIYFFFFRRNKPTKLLNFLATQDPVENVLPYFIHFFDTHCFPLLWYNLVSDKRTHGNTLSLDEKRDHTWVCNFRHFMMSFRPKARLILGISVCGEGNISAFDRRCFDSSSSLCLAARKKKSLK